MRLIIIIIMSLFMHELFSQDSIVYDNAYIEAIKIHINNSKKRFEKFDTILIWKTDLIDVLPKKIEGVVLKEVTKSFLYESTKKGKYIHVSKLRPIEIVNNKAYIYIVDYNVVRKKNHIIASNVDRSKVEIIFNCEIMKYEFINLSD